ncbi:MAG: translation initiation factor IF-3 [Candidatus Kuenenbacteria bacterium]
MQRRYRRPKPQKDLIKKFRANHQIRVPQVFLIDENGKQIGPTNISDALKKAQDAECDLVEVAPQANPPVAKIMDYGQYKYETEKKIRKAKVRQKKSELKAVRLSFRIKGQDLDVKRKQALKFLDDGSKVKINTVLRGREKAHGKIAIDNTNDFIKSLGENIKIIQPINSQGSQINVTISK